MSVRSDNLAEAGLAPMPPLVVDLDRRLLRSGLAHEVFWSALSSDTLATVRSVLGLDGRETSLTRRLSRISRLDARTLPYDAALVAELRRWRERGGRVILSTTGDRDLAQRIASHLGLFDEVRDDIGDDRFGEGGFTGNVAPDPLRDLPAAPLSWAPFLRALRPHQWLKNLLVFLPMLAAHRLEWGTFMLSLCAFVALSMAASSVYLLNDLLDIRADRLHLRKSRRPIASGELPIPQAGMMAGGLLMSSLLLSLLAGFRFAAVIIVYYAITLAYSLFLKRHAVIDICVLASLYTLRVIAGAAATGITPSVWLLTFSMFVFFSLASVKRLAELVDANRRGELKAAGRGYVVEDLPLVSNVAVASGLVSVLVLTFYASSPTVAALYSQPALLWGVPCILLYWITRMVMIAHRGAMHDDPLVFAISDTVSQICLAASAVIVLGSVLL